MWSEDSRISSVKLYQIKSKIQKLSNYRSLIMKTTFYCHKKEYLYIKITMYNLHLEK